MVKILHIASFVGNIGDNASHMGFYNILDTFFDDYNLVKIEIRKFYKNYVKKDKMEFNSDLINYINSFDICFIGGGGFLDYWVPNSKTGTTIDIDPKLIKLIKTPTLFTSIGSNPHKEVPSENIKKYKLFLTEIEKNLKTEIFLRNDGSLISIKNDIGKSYVDNMKEILDHGFFYDNKIDTNIFNFHDYVAINITIDQLDMLSKVRGLIDKEAYYKELSTVISYIVSDLKMKVVLVPHIYSDIQAINLLFTFLDDTIKRSEVCVAPYIQGDKGSDILFSIYKNSKFVIGTRFHANVCSLAMNKKTIGLLALDRVKYLFDYFGLSKNTISINEEFSLKLITLLKNKNFTQESQKIEIEKRNTLKLYESFFVKNNLPKSF